MSLIFFVVREQQLNTPTELNYLAARNTKSIHREINFKEIRRNKRE